MNEKPEKTRKPKPQTDGVPAHLAKLVSNIIKDADKLARLVPSLVAEGSEEAAKLKDMLDDSALRPELAAMAKKLNKLSPKELDVVLHSIDSQLDLLSRFRS